MAAVARATTIEQARARVRIGDPPIPHEHGAWVILYAPLVIGLAVARPFSPFPALLLTLAVTGAFLVRNAAGLMLRNRGKDGVGFWLAVYVAMMAAGALPLLAVYRAYGLLVVGVVAAGIFGIHALLTVWPPRRRWDRSQWGEVLGVGALALTGPAAWTVATGSLPAVAWFVWLGCALYFSSAIFHVKMMLAAVKVKSGVTRRMKLLLGRDCLIYHTLLTAIVVTAAARVGGTAGLLGGLAFAPGILRAFYANARLTNKLPPLKRVGILETTYSLWFMGFFLSALLAAHP